MNCQQLHQDIATLTAERDKLIADFARVNETMTGKPALKELSAKIDQLENQILEKYLDNFADQNPKIFSWQDEEQIAVFEFEDTRIINTIARLPNGSMLIGGDALYEYKQDENGEWKLGKINGFQDSGYSGPVRAIAELPDGGMLVGGGLSKLYEFRLDESGEWQLGYKIDGFKSSDGWSCSVDAIAPLPDGGMLVGGGDGRLYECRPDANGKWQLGKSIEGFGEGAKEVEAYGDDAELFTYKLDTIYTIAELPDGGMLIGGDDGRLYECRQDENGDWKLGNKIEGFEDSDGQTHTIVAIAELPDGGMLVGGAGGVLRECRQDDGGEWKLGEQIDMPKNKYGEGITINDIIQLQDGSMLIARDGSTLYQYKQSENGEWQLKELSAQFDEKNSMRAVAQMPDGSILTGRSGSGSYYNNGILGKSKKPPLTPSAVRQHLDELGEQE